MVRSADALDRTILIPLNPGKRAMGIRTVVPNGNVVCVDSMCIFAEKSKTLVHHRDDVYVPYMISRPLSSLEHQAKHTHTHTNQNHFAEWLVGDANIIFAICCIQ